MKRSTSIYFSSSQLTFSRKTIAVNLENHDLMIGDRPRFIMQSAHGKIVELIKRDPIRTKALHHVSRLNLPQCYIAAGFVRNLVWDSLHAAE